MYKLGIFRGRLKIVYHLPVFKILNAHTPLTFLASN
jgi:hypothetical protein